MKLAGIVQEFTPYVRALSEANQNGRITLEGDYKRRGHKYLRDHLLSRMFLAFFLVLQF